MPLALQIGIKKSTFELKMTIQNKTDSYNEIIKKIAYHVLDDIFL